MKFLSTQETGKSGGFQNDVSLSCAQRGTFRMPRNPGTPG